MFRLLARACNQLVQYQMDSTHHSSNPIGRSQVSTNLTEARNNVVDLLGEFLELMVLPSTEDGPADSGGPKLPPMPMFKAAYPDPALATFKNLLNKKIADIPPLDTIRGDPSDQSRDEPSARVVVESESETNGADAGRGRRPFVSATKSQVLLRDRLDNAVMTRIPAFVHKYMKKHGPTSGKALLHLLSRQTIRKANIGADGKVEVDSHFCRGSGGLYAFSRLSWLVDLNEIHGAHS